MNNKDQENDVAADDEIPEIVIIDPYAYLTKGRVIANVLIKGTQGDQRRKILKTSKGGYLFQ